MLLTSDALQKAPHFNSYNDRMMCSDTFSSYYPKWKTKRKQKLLATQNGLTIYLSLLPHVELLDEVVLLRVSAISFLAVDRRSVDMLFLTDEKWEQGHKSTGMVLYTAHIYIIHRGLKRAEVSMQERKTHWQLKKEEGGVKTLQSLLYSICYIV